MSDEDKLFKNHTYPTVNYIGNKEKISEWICLNIPGDVATVFDAFSGGASVAYALKQHGKKVITNDILKINYHIARALIVNNHDTLNEADVALIFSGTPFKGFVFKHYADTLFFADECMQLDLYRKNIDALSSEFKKSLAFTLLRRAMIRKMPYSRFNIKWEKVKQLRDEEYSYAHYGRKRAYHNQSFEYHFRKNLAEYNAAVFNNGQEHQAHNTDALSAIQHVKADLIYLDPPYTGTMNNYFDFYSFLDNYIDQKMNTPFANSFTDKKTAVELFDQLFAGLSNYKYWMLSYNSASYPTKEILLELLNKYAKNVTVVERKHSYKLTGKEKKHSSTEYLFIAERRI